MLVIDQYGGSICAHPGLINEALKQVNPNLILENASPTQYVHAKTEVAQRFLSALMITAADRSRYGSMVCDLENDYTHGIDGLPKTVADAYSYIANYLPAPKAKGVDNAEGLAFVTTGDDNQNKFPHIKCRKCGKMRHYANMCKTILDQNSTLAFILGDTKLTAAGNFTFAQVYVRYPRAG
eukprot:4288792-Ditylum_brightwellii.AAC.1